jgi:hypothetical protein
MTTTVRAARDLAIGHHFPGIGIVTKIDTTTTPGVVAVWLDGNTAAKADAIFAHGDPVFISDLNDWTL